MQDEFVNRLGMFRTALGTLNADFRRPVLTDIFFSRVSFFSGFLRDHG